MADMSEIHSVLQTGKIVSHCGFLCHGESFLRRRRDKQTPMPNYGWRHRQPNIHCNIRNASHQL